MTDSYNDHLRLDTELEMTEDLQLRVDTFVKHCSSKDVAIALLLERNDFLESEYDREREESSQIKQKVRKAIEQIKCFKEELISTFDEFEIIDVDIDLFEIWRKDRFKNKFKEEKND